MSEHQNPTDWRNSFVVGFDKCLSRSHMSFEVKSAGVLKMFKHRNSGGHEAAERILATTENKVMEQMSARLQKSREHSTQRIFRTAYYLAKRRRPFADMPELVDSQALYGAEMRVRVLQTDVSCAAVTVHIAAEMRRRLCDDIV